MERAEQRRPMIGVIGGSGVTPGSEKWRIAERLGRQLVDAGYRIACGGMGGVMEGACRGAHESESYVEGCTVGILPGARRGSANDYVDVVIATDLSHARNALVAQSDGVVAVGGGAGTLSEMAFAWMRNRLVVALDVEGWSGEMAGRRIDDRPRSPAPEDDRVFAVSDAEEAVRTVDERLEEYGGVP